MSLDSRVEPRPDSAASPPSELSRAPSRVVQSIGAVLVVLVIGLLTINPQAHLLTDVGGKTASMAAMDAGGGWDPDIGYWFEAQDPEGRFHPIAKSRQTTNGTWINTTSLTMLYAARPLWAIGGVRAAILLPLIGTLLAALAAAALHRRIAGPDRAHEVILLVGVGSPLLLYGLDFWEHSIAAAAMTAGAVLTLDSTKRWRLREPLLAGLCFGLAATMRQEALISGFVAGCALAVVGWRGRQTLGALVPSGVAMIVGALAPIGAHTILEQHVLGELGRTARSTATLETAGSGASERLVAAFTQLASAFGSLHPIAVVSSGAIVLAFGAAALWARRSPDRGDETIRPILIGLAASWALWWLLSLQLGFTFVPGLFVAMPFALFGIVGGLDQRRWLVLALGLAPIPLVLATAFTDGLLVQWGGRYLLTPGIILTVLGHAWLRARSPQLFRAVAAIAVMVTLVGAVFVVDRSRSAGAELDAFLEASNDSVVVWRNPHFSREFGERSLDQRWLSAGTDEDRRVLGDLLRAEGVDEFFLVTNQSSEHRTFPGYIEIEQLDEGFESRGRTVHRLATSEDRGSEHG